MRGEGGSQGEVGGSAQTYRERVDSSIHHACRLGLPVGGSVEGPQHRQLLHRRPTCLLLSGAQGDANRSDSDEDKTSTRLEEDFDKCRDLQATDACSGGAGGRRHCGGIPFPGTLQAQAAPSPSRDEDVLTGCDPQWAPGRPRQPAPAPHHAYGGHAHAHTQELPTPRLSPGPPGLTSWQRQLCGPPAGRPEVSGRPPVQPQGTQLLTALPRDARGPHMPAATPMSLGQSCFLPGEHRQSFWNSGPPSRPLVGGQAGGSPCKLR